MNAVDIYDDMQLHAEQLTYKSHPGYSVSDHKPVTGEFDIAVSVLSRGAHTWPTFSHTRANDNTFVLQVRPNVTDEIVEFQDFIVADHFISYKLQRDFTPGNADWIGLFSSDFSSLDDYIVYEYVGRGEFARFRHISDFVSLLSQPLLERLF